MILTDFLSDISVRNIPVISADVADFIENRMSRKNCSDQMVLNIHSNCIDEAERKKYKIAIKEYFRENYEQNQQELKAHYTGTCVLAILGIVILAIAYTIQFEFLQELVDTAACFFLWEVVDRIAFKSRELRRNKKRYLALLNMRIEYIEE